jgi:hypothetical protein
VLGDGVNRLLFWMYGCRTGGECLSTERSGSRIAGLFSKMSDLERSAADTIVTIDLIAGKPLMEAMPP